MKKTRKPVVAGFFYPSNKNRLLELIEWSFKHRYGPGNIPRVSETRNPISIGYVVPHAGYIYSGPVAAYAYYNMASEGVPDTIIILGTNHTGYGQPISVYPGGVWETPLGVLEVDDALGKKIVEHGELVDFDEYAHIEEHSIEVQLPFIQYIYGDRVKIVPIVIGIHVPEAARALAQAVLNAISELKRDTIILASSDLNHYEPHDVTVDKDNEAINKILELDTQGFYETVLRRDISICGVGGIMTLIEIAKYMNYRATLLKHITSGDISGDKSAVVGYATIRFNK